MLMTEDNHKKNNTVKKLQRLILPHLFVGGSVTSERHSAVDIGCRSLVACLLISGPTLDRRKSKLSGDILIYLKNVTNRKGS